MPSDPSRPPKRGWQHSAKPAAHPGRRQNWKAETTSTPQGPSWLARRWKLIAAGGSFFGLALAFIIVLLFFRPPTPARLLLIGEGFEEDLAVPHNVCGMQALDGLKQLGEEDSGGWSFWGSGRPRWGHGPQALTREGLPKDWKDFKGDKLIVFVALPGGADGDGPYFLIGDGPGVRCPVRKVLEQLKELPDPQKLLIVDATQAPAYWPAGLVYNDFARQLKDLFEQESVPNLLILSASSPGEQSWIDPKWGRSAFAQSVLEGLQGKADKDGSGKVTVQELYEYVKDNVGRWASANRDAVQTPVLLGDHEKAANVDLVVVQRDASPPEPPDAIPDEKALRGAWDEWERLGKQSPSPAVYTPHLWRLYRETLLRYEQLLRAGDLTGKAYKLKDKLDALGKQLTPGIPDFAPESTRNALPLARTFGLLLPEKPTVADIERLAAENTDPRKAWKALEEKADADQKRLLSLKASRVLLEDLLDPKRPQGREALKQRADLLRLVAASGPAVEVNFLALLDRRLADPPPPPELVQKALQVNVLAEEIALGARGLGGGEHPYSEVVYEWVKSDAEKADHERRLGEDWLFASKDTPGGWSKAREHLDKARQLYEAVGADEKRVRRALALRDEALADLPFYSQWLAGRTARRDAGTDVGRLCDDAQTLWRNVYLLDRGLGARDPKCLEALDGIQAAFDSIRAAFRADCAKPHQDDQDSWHRIEALLAVPLAPDAKTRLGLLTQSQGVSQMLQRQAERQKDATARPQRDQAEQADLACKAGRRQAQLAAAALGEYGPAQPPESADPGRLAAAGQQLGAAWLGLPDRVNQRLDACALRDTVEGALGEAVLGARLCRLIDAAGAARVNDRAYGPGQAARRLRLYGLLTWMADRAELDHWYDESNKPYSLGDRGAASRYLADALKLARGGKDTEDRVNGRRAAEARERQKGLRESPLVLGGPPSLQETETRFRVDFKLSVPPGVRQGVPMLWLDLDRKLLLPPPAYADKTRQPELGLQAGRRDALLSYELENRQPDKQSDTAQVTARGLYRGQLLEAKTDLFFYRRPDVIVTKLQPTGGAGILVRAKDVPDGALAIVLDASASMGPPGFRWTKNADCKYNTALKTLRSVLDGVAPGTRVSLWVFGLRSDPGRAILEPILRPTAWPDARAARGQLIDDLMRDLTRDRGPVGESSPIVEAMVRAKQDLADAPAHKTLVVLTDGDDNTISPEATAQKFRSEFRGQAIFVHMVLFKSPTQDERDRALRQFEQPLKDLERWGRLDKMDELDAKEVARLRQALDEVMRPRVRLYLPSGREVWAQTGFRIRFPKEAGGEWLELQAGPYDAQLNRPTREAVQQRLDLRAGDRLLLDLRAYGGRLRFERAFYADEAEANAGNRQRDRDGWRFAVLQNQNQDGRRVELLMTLEETESRMPPDDRQALGQIRPLFEWFDVKPRGSDPAPPLRWWNEPGYPAPAWRLRAEDWPGAQPPAVQVWWDDRGVYQASQREVVHAPLQDLKDLPGTIPGLGGEFTLEARAGKEPVSRADRPADCLVVTVKGVPPGERLWCEMDGLNYIGQEHRYFTQAREYKVYFWDVTAEQAKTKRFTLRFVKLSEVLPRLHTLSLEPGEPTPSEKGPPPIPLRKPE